MKEDTAIKINLVLKEKNPFKAKGFLFIFSLKLFYYFIIFMVYNRY
jgi:hypothetical protein